MKEFNPSVSPCQPLTRIAEILNIDSDARLGEYRRHWITSRRQITLLDIDEHFRGKKTIGHNTTPMVDVVCYDLDAHDALPTCRDELLAIQYNVITAAHGYPAMVIRTHKDGGIHCYYFLLEKVPHETIRRKMNEISPGIEVLPLPRSESSNGRFIRTPFDIRHGGHALNPETLMPLPVKKYEEILSTIIDASNERIPVARFLSLTAEMGRAIFSRKKTTRMKRGIAVAGSLLEITRRIRQGETNDAILAMVRGCFFAGFIADDAVQFIDAAMANAPIIRREDTQGRGLELRIRSCYRNFKVFSTHKARALIKPRGDRVLWQEQTVQAIVDRARAAFPLMGNRRRGCLRKFVGELFNAVQRVKDLSDAEKRFINLIWRGFYWRVAKGEYPLPWNLMFGWVQNYRFYIDILIKIGVLEPTWKGPNGGYCPAGQGDYYREKDRGKCRFYRVFLNDFPNP